MLLVLEITVHVVSSDLGIQILGLLELQLRPGQLILLHPLHVLDDPSLAVGIEVKCLGQLLIVG